MEWQITKSSGPRRIGLAWSRSSLSIVRKAEAIGVAFLVVLKNRKEITIRFMARKITSTAYLKKDAMRLPKDSQEKLFTATNEFKGFLPDDGPMMVFSDTIYPVFKDGEFADCYSDKGRNAISPAFPACVTPLQFRENLSDTETAV
jgi:hypothetical protein